MPERYSSLTLFLFPGVFLAWTPGVEPALITLGVSCSDAGHCLTLKECLKPAPEISWGRNTFPVPPLPPTPPLVMEDEDTRTLPWMFL